MCRPHAPLRFSAVDQRRLFGIVLATMLTIGQPTAHAETAQVTVGGPFTLTASDGSTVTDQTYRGKWLLVLFGYTSCPNLCPTVLNEVTGALQIFGAEAARLQPIFITVDPVRDTPEVMGKYTSAFDPRIVGLTGNPQQIAAITQEYGAYSEHRKTGAGAGDYVVDHSTYIYIVDPLGNFVRGLDFDTPSDRIVEILRKLMTQSRE